MENTIEITEEKKKLGAGIITLSIIYIIGQVIGIGSTIVSFFIKDEMNSILEGTGVQMTSLQLIISLVVSIILLTSVILILSKKAIGVFLFIGIIILNFVYTIISIEFTMFSLLGLILPALMIFFIYRKKDIYFAKA